MENKKRILIADASNEFRKLLCDTIGGEPDLEVVGATAGRRDRGRAGDGAAGPGEDPGGAGHGYGAAK